MTSIDECLKNLRRAGAWAVFAADAETEAEERERIQIAEFFLFEAQRLRRNAELNADFEARLRVEVEAA